PEGASGMLLLLPPIAPAAKAEHEVRIAQADTELKLLVEARLFADHGLAGRRLPKQGRAVVAATDQGLAVRTKDHGIDLRTMRQRSADRFAGVRVPQPGHVVASSGRHPLAVG